MTNKEKKELFIALCGYYPYGVICHVTDKENNPMVNQLVEAIENQE